jgi:biopolymer transport protein ExbB
MSRKALWSVFVVMLTLTVTSMAFAGEGGGEGEVVRKSWLDLFQATGLVGILLLLTSLVGTALLLQYMVNMSESKLSNPGLMQEVDSLLSEGQVDEAYNLVAADQSFTGKVMAGALSRSFGGYEEVRKGMEEASGAEVFRLNAKLSYLSLVGNIGPLMGLLGTVTGMISSFQVIESMKAPTPGDLAKGVYESLVNTTMGLFIAIIFLSAYFFMKNKIADLTLMINTQISEILSRGQFPEAGRAPAK